MVRAWVIAMWLLAGCHRVFNLEEVPPVPPTPDAAVTPEYCYPFAVDAAVGSDPDLDFVVSQDDNCPNIANTNQGDEDGDCRGDACDRCPWINSVDPDMADEDGDGIGNSCDPYPGFMNGYFFEGFNDDSATVAANFGTQGTWVTSNGAWVQSESTGLAFGWHTAANSSAGVVHLSVFVPAGKLYNIETTFMVGTWVLGYDDGLNYAGIRAGLAREQTNLWLRIEQVQGGLPTLLAQQQVLAEDLPSLLRFTVGYSTTLVDLQLATRTGMARTMATISIGGGLAGPFTLDTPADFQYFSHIY